MKKVLSVILSLIMVTMALTACSGNAQTGGETAGNTDSMAEDNNTAAESSETPVAEDTAGEEDAPDLSEHVTLKWYLCGSDNVTDDAAVLEKANQILGAKLNMTLQPIWGSWSDFEEGKVSLSINGGDDVDIYFTSSWTENAYMAFARKGAYVRLDDPENNLFEKYGSDLYDVIPEMLINSARIEGSDGKGIYAVPGYKDVATQNTWDVNVTLLEKYGYTLADIENTDYYGFGEILKTVKEGEGSQFYPLLVEGAVLERMVTNGIIVTGDASTNNLLSYYINPTDVSQEGAYGNVLLNKFATDEYKKFVEQTREYFLAGYIDPAMGNAQQASDVRTAKQLTGDYLIGTQSYSYGYETEMTIQRGITVAYVPCTPAYIDTTSPQGAMMAISSVSKNPERAMMFLNLLNTDVELMTLLNYGVEGLHYDMADGEVVFLDKRNDYQPWRNGMGNVTLLPPQEGQGADFQDQFKAYYGAAKSIPIVGFAVDATPIETEMAALANVAAEYALALSTGAVDPAEKLPAFLAELEKNGMQKVLDEANSQLEAFLAAQ